MTTFERVRFTTENGRLQSVILRDPARVVFLGADALTGIEVNRDGDEVASDEADERRRIIAAECVVWRKPMRWNLHYGTLEPI